MPGLLKEFLVNQGGRADSKEERAYSYVASGQRPLELPCLAAEVTNSIYFDGLMHLPPAKPRGTQSLFPYSPTFFRDRDYLRPVREPKGQVHQTQNAIEDQGSFLLTEAKKPNSCKCKPPGVAGIYAS
jgi:hypothetical protein